jgi:cytochrome c biogenesis protein CcmG/thiol:disulfide interchange protein DsbE
MSISPKTIGVVVLSLGIAGFLGLMALGLLNKSPVTGRSGVTRVNKPAADFSFSQFDGGEFVLSRNIGQPVVINFWASWCPPCREEARGLERAWQAYKEQGVVFVGVDIQDTLKDALAYLAEFDVTYPNGMDVDGTITVDYGVIGIPVTFFVNKDGIVERRWVGAISERQLIAWVEELAAGVALSEETDEENPEEFFKFE